MASLNLDPNIRPLELPVCLPHAPSSSCVNFVCSQIENACNTGSPHCPVFGLLAFLGHSSPLLSILEVLLMCYLLELKA